MRTESIAPSAVTNTAVRGLPRAVRPGTHALKAETPGNKIVDLLTDFPITHRRFKRGEHLFRSGDAFTCLYLLNAGFAKTCYLSVDGREQVTGFHMRGDTLGLDAVVTGHHACDAIALDVCDILAIPYEAMIKRAQQDPELIRQVIMAFGTELLSDHEQLMSMGSLAADSRVAAFLLELSRRFGERGFSDRILQLRLTRVEIGGLLGLKMETVSRAFSRFAKMGLIDVHLRDVTILDMDGLRAIVTMVPEVESCARVAA
ncbi:MAG: helix-turn-helix domain-containing protein [Usitatibacteraceae bacterium]